MKAPSKGKTKTKEMLLQELEEAEIIQVTAFQEGKAIGSWDFHGESITIGRSRSADLRLPTETISRLHAVLERTPEGILRIKDAGSRNGLYLNDQRVEAAVLTRSDTIRIGAFTLRCALRRQGEVSSLRAADQTVPSPIRRASEGADRPSKPTAATQQAAKVVPAAAKADLRGAVVEKKREPAASAAIADDFEVDGGLASILEPAPELDDLAVPQPAHTGAQVPPPGKPEQPHHDDLRETVTAYRDPDDEDADLDVEPGYSLVEALRSAHVPQVDPRKAVLEVICYRGEKVLQVAQVKSGGSYRLGRGPLATFDDSGVATVHLPPRSVGSLWDDKGCDELLGEDGQNACRLLSGETIEIATDGVSYLLRLVPAPEVETPGEVLISGMDGKSAGYVLGMGGASVAGHLVIMFIVLPVFMFLMAMLTRPSHQFPTDVEFADVQVELPDKPEPKKERPRKKQARKKVPKRLAKNAPRQRSTQRRSTSPSPTRSRAASAGIAGAMGNMNFKSRSNAPMLAAATNMKAVRVPGGGGYKTSGFAVKGKGVVNGRPGGAHGTRDIGTQSGQAFGARGGHGGVAKRGGGQVRGRVAAPPARNVGVKGHLDRSQIARVVNRHMNEVRHCYEKNLLSDPSLAGKLLVEWTIDPNGRVVSVKTKYSSLRGGAVPGCINSRIRRWQFPRPKGNGYVVVSYPFMFESVGF